MHDDARALHRTLSHDRTGVLRILRACLVPLTSGPPARPPAGFVQWHKRETGTVPIPLGRYPRPGLCRTKEGFGESVPEDGVGKAGEWLLPPHCPDEAIQVIRREV